MANEQTSVPLYAASEVLTAANMNISAGTGVPVFATTVTRDAAFGGAGEKVLAEGQLCYLSASNIVQYYDGAAWATVGPATAGALTFISSTSLNTGTTSVSVNSCFSATYDNYLVMIGGLIKSATTPANSFRMRVSSTDSIASYYWAGPSVTYAGSTVVGDSGDNVSSFRLSPRISSTSTATSSAVIWLSSPALATFTGWVNQGAAATDTLAYQYSGYHGVATAYDGFSILSAGGNFTGGTVKVYGLANS